MKNYLFATVLLSLLFNSSCNKDNSTPELSFNGITERDDNGQLTGQPDSTDWKLDDVWSPAIHNLFLSEPKPTCTDFGDYRMYNSRPNPTPGPALMGMMLQDTLDLEIRFVDRSLNLLRSHNYYNEWGFGYNEFFLDLSDLSCVNDTIRVYYKLSGEDCEMRGHGDIVILE